MKFRAEWEVECKVASDRLEAKIEEYAKQVEKIPAEVLPMVAKIFVKEVIKLTPPMRSLNPSESFADQKRIGENAVSGDIRSAFVPIDQLNVIRNPRVPTIGNAMRRVVRRGNPQEVAELLNRFGYRNVRADKVIAEPTEELHNKLRGARGRVLRSRVGSYFVRSGAKLKRFIGKKQKLVGKMKAGWTKAADLVGMSLPAWIRRHSPRGGVQDESKRFWNPFIRIWNSVSYAGKQNQDIRFVTIALRNVRGNLQRQLAAKMKGLW